MTRLLVYTDGKPDALRALHFAAKLKRRLNAELSVITVRSGTHAAEEPPPVGVKLTADQRTELPHGLQILLHAASVLVDEAVLTPIDTIKIRDIPQGYMFFCDGALDERIAFYVCFGHFVEAINKEVEEHGYSLLIVAPPRRGRLGHLVAGNTTRELALDLDTSLLVVHGGGPDSRFLICADGSPSSRRTFSDAEAIAPSHPTACRHSIRTPAGCRASNCRSGRSMPAGGRAVVVRMPKNRRGQCAREPQPRGYDSRSRR